MVFNSITFLIFIVIFIPVFYLLEGKYRLIFTLVSSCLFYGWWDWRFLGLLGFSTILDFTLGRRMENEENVSIRKRLLAASLIVNLGVLGFFKYFNFFVGSFNELMSQIGLP